MENTYNVTKNALIATIIPQETKSYKPVSHEELINLTLEGILKSGFILDTETYSAAKEGQIANAKFTIKNVADPEMQLQIGWQNSYNKELTLKFALGTRIFICKNGCVSGDFGAFKKKHVGEIQTFTPQAITEYIKRAGDSFTRIQKERETMKQFEISPRVRAELIGRMIIENDFITTTQLNIIKNEIKTPTFNYGAPNSLWELYNFTTYALKDIHPSLWFKNHINTHAFFVEASGMSKQENTSIELPVINQLEMTFNELG